MGGAGSTHRSLGDVLDARRRHRFVGRSSELDLVREILGSDDLEVSVLHLHGPGGVGKSYLLDEIADVARDTNALVARVDGREVPPTPRALQDALSPLLASSDGDNEQRRVVVLIDTYERFASIDDWIRTSLLPRLPATSLTVMAGRAPPTPQWRTDPGWGELLRVISIRNLSPAESIEYLGAVGVDQALHSHIASVTHGHPLGLALLADVVLHGGPVSRDGAASRDGTASRNDIGADDPLPPDLVGILLQRFIEVIPTDLHRRALEVCAMARVTTEPLLRGALGITDAHDVFVWLRGLSFVYASGEGLYPHDLARDALDADLRWRDFDGYKQVFHGLWEHIRRHLHTVSGHEQQHAIVDLKYVFRHFPGVLSPVDWDSWGGFYPEPATTKDHAAILDMVRSHEGDESAAIARIWLDRQPDAFYVLRRIDGDIRGFAALIDLTRADEADIAADPGTQAAWNHARQSAPCRRGEVVTQTRFIVDRAVYQDPSPTLNAVPVLTMQQYLCTPNLSWDFLTLADPDRWNDYFAVADLPRVEGADFRVGGTTFGLFAHDFRQVPVDAWLETVTERVLTRDTSPPAVPSRPEFLVLSQAEFYEAAKQALRDLHHPDLLVKNPLVHTRLFHDWAGGDRASDRTLAELIRDAVDALSAHPRDDKLLRAVDRTYLRPATTQESAAAMLGLPFSTYRRHLGQGVTRIVSWMWDREVYGTGEQK
ncbi:MAG: ATP-binding protein [Rhodococcus sp.]|nr:ATP-binding protein [Rhodococcus sp. (in: high G+C Gram-positive bacteria)]